MIMLFLKIKNAFGWKRMGVGRLGREKKAEKGQDTKGEIYASYECPCVMMRCDVMCILSAVCLSFVGFFM